MTLGNSSQRSWQFAYYKLSKVSIAAALICILFSPSFAHAEWTLNQGALVHPDYYGHAPKKSDVIFSTRFTRPEAIAAIRDYGASRVEWVYSTNRQFVESILSEVDWFGGTVSSTIPLPQNEGIALNFEDQPIVAPWMKSWGAKWITTTSSRTRKALETLAQQYLLLGAKSIHVDDPMFQYSTVNWAGDFSESSIAGFNEFLAKYPNQNALEQAGIIYNENFNYRRFLTDKYGIESAKTYQEMYRRLPTTPLWQEYLKESVIAHYADFRVFLNKTKGHNVPLSMNLPLYGPDDSDPFFSLISFIDYAMVETRIDDFAIMSLQAATYRSLGIGYVPSILPLEKSANRIAIATLYALGGQPLVPWDIYINNGPDQQPTRFFGYSEDYADLFQFVRRNSRNFDNFEEIAVVGIVIPIAHYQRKPTLDLVRRLDKARVPFSIIPIGDKKQRYGLNQGRANHFRLLITANPESDFSANEIGALKKLQVKMLNVTAVSDNDLEALSPYLSPSSAKIRMIARGSSYQPNKIVVHVIRPNEKSNDAATRACEKTVGLRRDVLDPATVIDATWHSLSQVRQLSMQRVTEGLSVQLPDCDEWGLLEFTLHTNNTDY